MIYEGYVLYPYRASAAKNQLRWQFGVLAPRPFSERTSSEPWAMQTECVLEAPASALVRVQVRFLRVQARLVQQARPDEGDEFTPVASLEVDGQLWTTWDESTEHQIDLGPLAVASLLLAGCKESVASEVEFALEGREEREKAAGRLGKVVGRVFAICVRSPVGSRSRRRRSMVPGGLTRLRVRVENLTPWLGGPDTKRDETVRNSLVAVHVLAAVDDGRFISSLDPPDYAESAVASCANIGSFPVLIGENGADDVHLVVADHPLRPSGGGAREPGRHVRRHRDRRDPRPSRPHTDRGGETRGPRTDDLAASIIDRCDAMPPEVFERLHGAIRSVAAERPSRAGGTEPAPCPGGTPRCDASVDPAHDTIVLGAVEVGKGAKVRLNPTRRADAQDFFLAGRCGDRGRRSSTTSTVRCTSRSSSRTTRLRRSTSGTDGTSTSIPTRSRSSRGAS